MKKDFTKQDFYKNLKENDTGCLEWQGARFRNGYGATWIKGKLVGTHRVALEIEGIDIKDKFVLHSCDNRLCCNPAHLRTGTVVDNARDAVERDRYRTGESHYKTPLSQDDINTIRYMFEQKIRQVDIAEHFNITQAAVSRIVNNKTWKPKKKTKF